MNKEWSWFDIVLGMHNIAKQFGYLWGHLPAGTVAAIVARVSGPEQIPEKIVAAVRERFPFTHTFEGGYIIGEPRYAELGYLVQEFSDGRLVVSGCPNWILIENWGEDGGLSLEIPAGEPIRIKGNNVAPRHYVRVFRTAVEGEWARYNIWLSIPEHIFDTDEYKDYMGLDLDYTLLTPQELREEAEVGEWIG